MKKYKKIVYLAGPVFYATTFDCDKVTRISALEVTLVDEYLENGWELIEILTHRSEKLDQTAIVIVLGQK